MFSQCFFVRLQNFHCLSIELKGYDVEIMNEIFITQASTYFFTVDCINCVWKFTFNLEILITGYVKKTLQGYDVESLFPLHPHMIVFTDFIIYRVFNVFIFRAFYLGFSCCKVYKSHFVLLFCFILFKILFLIIKKNQCCCCEILECL